MNQEQQKAMEALAALDGLSAREVAALLYIRQNVVKRAAEDAKRHPLRQLKLSEAEFEAWCNHITDGGGQNDTASLAMELGQASLDRNQHADYWHVLTHYVKASLIRDGIIRPVQGGGVGTSGIAPKLELPLVPSTLQAALPAPTKGE